MSSWKFPLLDRALAVSDTIKERAGWDEWKNVLDAVRKSEARGEGFESLPAKVKEVILAAEA